MLECQGTNQGGRDIVKGKQREAAKHDRKREATLQKKKTGIEENEK